MSIFIENFERTESSDEIFGVVGRALAIATRFDSLCKTLARAIDLPNFALLHRYISDHDFYSLLENALEKSLTLDKSINKLELPDDISFLLHEARRARNAVAHDLAVGLEGCVDTTINEKNFLNEVSKYIFDLARGDVMISLLMRNFNGEDPIRAELAVAYIDKIVNWVIDK